jgi:phycocyanin-associated, rod
MTMNTVFNLSGDAGRKCAIDVAGSPNQAMMRSSAYTVKVPYSSLAQTIHSIGKRGGKVVNVRMLSVAMPGAEDIPVASGVLIPFEVETAPSPKPPTKTVEPPKAESPRPSSKSKKR